jgi:hypothetical protein
MFKTISESCPQISLVHPLQQQATNHKGRNGQHLYTLLASSTNRGPKSCGHSPGHHHPFITLYSNKTRNADSYGTLMLPISYSDHYTDKIIARLLPLFR